MWSASNRASKQLRSKMEEHVRLPASDGLKDNFAFERQRVDGKHQLIHQTITRWEAKVISAGGGGDADSHCMGRCRPCERHLLCCRSLPPILNAPVVLWILIKEILHQIRKVVSYVHWIREAYRRRKRGPTQLTRRSASSAIVDEPPSNRSFLCRLKRS